MMTEPRTFPPMPEIGRPEMYYANGIHQAEQQGEMHLREAFKVGQYVTLAMDPHLGWEEKLKYFRHAIRRHCQPPAFADDETEAFYSRMADLVRQHAGMEALRLACQEDDIYATRLAMNQPREDIESDAEEFFAKLIPPGDSCPEWFTKEDYHQLKMIRDQWI